MLKAALRGKGRYQKKARPKNRSNKQARLHLLRSAYKKGKRASLLLAQCAHPFLWLRRWPISDDSRPLTKPSLFSPPPHSAAEDRRREHQLRHRGPGGWRSGAQVHRQRNAGTGNHVEKRGRPGNRVRPRERSVT